MFQGIRRSIKSIFLTILAVLLTLILISYFTERRFICIAGKKIGMVEERQDRVKPDSKSLKQEETSRARQICEERGWKWDDIRVHAYKGVITLWRPSKFGSSDSMTVDVKTGRVISELKIEPGSSDGAERYVSKYYNKDGSAVETSYKGGVPHGLRREYYPNGNIRSEIQFNEGKKHGKERIYDEEGVLLKEMVWYNNVIK